MILTHEMYRVRKAGPKSRQGYIILPSKVSNRLKWEPQEVSVVLLTEEDNEDLDLDEFKKLWAQFLAFKALDKEMKKLKSEVFGDETTNQVFDSKVPIQPKKKKVRK